MLVAPLEVCRAAICVVCWASVVCRADTAAALEALESCRAEMLFVCWPTVSCRDEVVDVVALVETCSAAIWEAAVDAEPWSAVIYVSAPAALHSLDDCGP